MVNVSRSPPSPYVYDAAPLHCLEVEPMACPAVFNSIPIPHWPSAVARFHEHASQRFACLADAKSSNTVQYTLMNTGNESQLSMNVVFIRYAISVTPLGLNSLSTGSLHVSASCGLITLTGLVHAKTTRASYAARREQLFLDASFHVECVPSRKEATAAHEMSGLSSAQYGPSDCCKPQLRNVIVSQREGHYLPLLRSRHGPRRDNSRYLRHFAIVTTLDLNTPTRASCNVVSVLLFSGLLMRSICLSTRTMRDNFKFFKRGIRDILQPT